MHEMILRSVSVEFWSPIITILLKTKTFEFGYEEVSPYIQGMLEMSVTTHYTKTTTPNVDS